MPPCILYDVTHFREKNKILPGSRHKDCWKQQAHLWNQKDNIYGPNTLFNFVLAVTIRLMHIFNSAFTGDLQFS